MKKTLFLTIFFIKLTAHIYSHWSIELLHRKNLRSIDLINTQKFRQTKTFLQNELANSWCSKEKLDLLLDLVVYTQPKVSVEIGAFNGSTVIPIACGLKLLRKGKIYAIDAWSNKVATQYLDRNDLNRKWWSELDMSAVKRSFVYRIKKLGLTKYCQTIHKSSLDAAQSINERIDFLHIDGDYSEKSSLEDVKVYLPKVRSGGYILLSGLYTIVNQKQPKISAFCALYDECDLIASIDNDNAALFKKR